MREEVMYRVAACERGGCERVATCERGGYVRG